MRFIGETSSQWGRASVAEFATYIAKPPYGPRFIQHNGLTHLSKNRTLE
jgi:hypothetical protein